MQHAGTVDIDQHHQLTDVVHLIPAAQNPLLRHPWPLTSARQTLSVYNLAQIAPAALGESWYTYRNIRDHEKQWCIVLMKV